MKVLMVAALALTAANASARMAAPAYPSCDIPAQHAVRGHIGGATTDPRQAHIAERADVLQADLGNARTARRLTQAMTGRLYRRVAAIRTGADCYTKRQGFLSAAEVASYDRELDGVAAQLCRR